MERLRGEEGEIGAESKHFYNENGRVVVFIEEIMAADQGQFFQSILRNDKIEITISNSLTPIENDSTLLEISAELRPQNIISRILTFFSYKKMALRQAADLQRFRNAIEELTEDFE